VTAIAYESCAIWIILSRAKSWRIFAHTWSAVQIAARSVETERSLSHLDSLAHESFWSRVSRTLWPHGGLRVARLGLLAASVAVLAMLATLASNFVRGVRAADYVETAVATHRSYVDGNLPLQLRSDSPAQVTAWFRGKVSFPFRLPKSQATPDNLPAYNLSGASLVKYHGKPAPLVIYQKQGDEISLLFASADSAIVAGGEEVRSGILTFHYRTEQGFNVVTWSNHGLSYALVSSIAGSARESCMICHQSMADRLNFNSAQ
jgi:hypothetical protein